MSAHSSGTAVARVSESDLVVFDPANALNRESQADAVIAHAKRVKDWPLLEKAVVQKLDDQTEFIAWWEAAVREVGQPKKVSAPTEANTLARSAAEKLTGITHQQVSKWRRRLQDIDKYRALLYGAAYAKAMAQAAEGPHVAQNAGDNEWYTPSEYIEAARKVLGTIDLDPASSSVANDVIGAKKFYTEKDDGLSKPWKGKLWMNPPYAQPLCEKFCTRLAEEYAKGSVSDAIVLVNNATETAWFQTVAVVASAVCFPKGRVKFWHPRKEAVPLQGQAVLYLGKKVPAFLKAFDDFGWLATVTRV